MKRKLICGLSVCVIGLTLAGCEGSSTITDKNVINENLYKDVVEDEFKFSSEDIEYIFNLTKDDLINKFGEVSFDTDGITAKDIESKIYWFADGSIVAAISNDIEKVVVLNSTDNSMEHIKGIEIGDSLETAISKLYDGLEFDLNSAEKVLEWDGGYYIRLYGDVNEDMIHNYHLKESIGYAVYQNFVDGFTQIVLKDNGIEIVISITDNAVSGISYSC